MIGQINPFAPIPAPGPTAPATPPEPKPSTSRLSPKTVAGVQASYQTPEAPKNPAPPAPPKGTVQGSQLKPGWGGGQ